MKTSEDALETEERSKAGEPEAEANLQVPSSVKKNESLFGKNKTTERSETKNLPLILVVGMNKTQATDLRTIEPI